MFEARKEYASVDDRGRHQSARRMVKLPGEKRHVERSESAVYFARKLEIDKREKRMKESERGR